MTISLNYFPLTIKVRESIFFQLSKKYLRSLLALYNFYQHRTVNYSTPSVSMKINQSDFVVLYRISPYKNGKSPVFTNNKHSLVNFCLTSFFRSFKHIKPKTIFILDSCPKKYLQLIRTKCPFDYETLTFQNLGNIGTFYTQLAIAQQLPAKTKVYFAEDDYYYLPEAGEQIVQALNVFDFVTLYDHREHYNTPWVDNKYHITINKNHHWRTCVSACLTFGTTVGMIQKNYNTFIKYGTFDHPMWLELIEKGHSLYSPIPSLATHLVRNMLAPTVEWEAVWKRDLKTLL